MKIGKYRILFNPHKLFWFQTYKPTIARQFGWFLIIEEVDLARVGKKRQFPLGTKIEYGGKKYRYYKAGGKEEK